MIFLSFLIPVRSIYMLCSTFRRDWRKLRWYVYRNVIIYLYVIVCYKEHRNFCNSNRISLFFRTPWFLLNLTIGWLWLFTNWHNTQSFLRKPWFLLNLIIAWLTVYNIGIISCKTQDEDKQSNNKHKKQKDDSCWSLLQKGNNPCAGEGSSCFLFRHQ